MIFHLFASLTFFLAIHPLAYLIPTPWPHCCHSDRPACFPLRVFALMWPLMESFPPENLHGSLSTSSAVCSPVIYSAVLPYLKLHPPPHTSFPLPLLYFSLCTFHYLISIDLTHLRISNLFFHSRRQAPWGQVFFLGFCEEGLFCSLFFPARKVHIHTHTQTHTHTDG